jgi:hypothetical protein
MGAISTGKLLDLAGVAHTQFELAKGHPVTLTECHQLVAEYKNLKRAQGASPPYRGWHAHHVVEYQDLVRLGVAELFPPYDEQLCVLLPEGAHMARVTSDLRREIPRTLVHTRRDYLQAYREAYDNVGDYSGARAGGVKRELMAIVRATFRAAGLA